MIETGAPVGFLCVAISTCDVCWQPVFIGFSRTTTTHLYAAELSGDVSLSEFEGSISHLKVGFELVRPKILSRCFFVKLTTASEKNFTV